MKARTFAPCLAAILGMCLAPSLAAQAPPVIGYQGRVAVSGVDFQGAGQFKFALVNPDGSFSFWSNDGTSVGGSEPTGAVTIPVNGGKFAVHLGDTTIGNMTSLPATVFTLSETIYLRIWFNDGVSGWKRLTPDQRIAAVPYAQVASKALEFTGTLLGDVTGGQYGTMLVSIAGQTVSAVANGAALANAASSSSWPNAIVRRDQNGDFLAHTATLEGILALPATTLTGGYITIDGIAALHMYGNQNTFVGGAGNFTMTGALNTGIGAFALNFNTSGLNNTANGARALNGNTSGHSNTASGADALRSNTTGELNTANGYTALYSNTSGYQNTANGSASLYFNTTGNNNVAVGADALFSNLSGNRNTAVGVSALRSNTSAHSNTATGKSALEQNATGTGNTAIGANALFSNTTGNGNTAAGLDALRDNTTGAQNTANGFGALLLNTTGTNNIALGYNAGNALTTGDNNIAIGNPGGPGESNTIRIGTPGIHTATHLSGAVYGESFNITSDRNAKTDFASVDAAAILAKVVALPISTWRFKHQPDARHIGPMAQDFYAAFGVGVDDRHIATVDADGVAFAAIQGLYQKVQNENRNLTAQNQKLAEAIQSIADRISSIERRLDLPEGGND